MDLQSTSLAMAERAPATRRTAARPAPERSPEHAHLTLEELRAYRRDLTAEEGRVSYWRRIIQARLDLVRAGTTGDSERLRPVLTDERVLSGRTALVEILPVDDIPPLPDLAGLWERQATPDDPQAQAELVEALAVAERQLSDYRSALHRRLSAATAELIARYREEPALCLSALPLPPQRRAVPA